MASDNTAAERAAAIYKLMESAKLYGCDSEDYLARVSTQIADYPSNRVDPCDET